MIEKSIEIYYNISEIPGITDRSAFSPEALKFRNEAIQYIEDALIDAYLCSEWLGAEIGIGQSGEGEVNFGFSVADFYRAEIAIRRAVAGSRFENIREIVRNEPAYAPLIKDDMILKTLGFIERLQSLLFKRPPKRFHETKT